jgi:hypothetical protein
MAEERIIKSPSLDSSYLYPTELLEIMVDTLPRLIKSKAQLLDFFEEAGTPREHLAEWRAKVEHDRQSVSKYHITRSILRSLNEKRDEARPVRREILRRIANIKDFSSGWDDDRERAERLVTWVREVASEKDACTWTTAARETFGRQAKVARFSAAEEHRKAFDDLKRDFYALFSFTDRKARSQALRSVLPRLFDFYGIPTNVAQEFGCDAACLIDFESERHLVELHWSDKPLGMATLAPSLVRLFSSDTAGAVFISPSGFADGAVADCHRALHQKLVILCHLEEFVMLLEHEKDLAQLLRLKVTAAKREQNPFVRFTEQL